MNIVFCGTAPQVGTSANMAVVQEALRCRGIAVDDICFVDCSQKRENIRKYSDDSTLVIVNLLIPDKELENFYFSHLRIRKNVIFLFGKYFQQNEKELKRFLKEYRMDAGQVATIPYNLRFGRAFEMGMVKEYLRQKPRSIEDETFALLLWKTTQKILRYM